MALLKSTQTDCIYLFDSHSRNGFGMPDPNGTAVVMEFANVFYARTTFIFPHLN